MSSPLSKLLYSSIIVGYRNLPMREKIFLFLVQCGGYSVVSLCAAAIIYILTH